MAVENQLAHNTEQYFYNSGVLRSGQRLTIPAGRSITKLGFIIRRISTPGGTVNFTIRRVSDDAVLATKLWGNANDLPIVNTLIEGTFASPVDFLVATEVRIYFEPLGGGGGGGTTDVFLRSNSPEVKAGELLSYYSGVAWTDAPTFDSTYQYTYGLLVGKTAHMADKMIAAGMM